MNTAERRSEIMRMLKKNETLDVSTFSKRLGVTNVTIRNDLAFLAKQGLVVRTYGGAVLAGKKDMIRLVSNVLNEYLPEKESIARAASLLVKGGMQVLIDTGSTSYQLVPFIKDLPITIVTNSLLVASQIHPNSIPDLLLVGGDLSKYCMGFVGSIAQEEISRIYADVLFLGAAGYSIKENVLTCATVEEAAVKQAMIHHAKKVVLLADSSKNEKRGFISFGKMTDLHCLITDALAREERDVLQEKGVETIVTN